MNADGSDLERLTNNPASDGLPVWSPNGSRIAFASDRDGDFEIYTMASDGSDVKRVTNNAAFDVLAAWRP